MKEFEMLCKEFEQMDVVSYTAYLTEKSTNVLPALQAAAENGVDGAAIFFSFIMSAIAADGKLAEEEYAIISPLLRAFFNRDVTYEECQKAFKEYKKEAKQLKTIANQMVDILGLFSDDLKNDIVIICLMICAIDGKVSLKEKRWIKQLAA